jgi:hypothetical protein
MCDEFPEKFFLGHDLVISLILKGQKYKKFPSTEVNGNFFKKEG